MTVFASSVTHAMETPMIVELGAGCGLAGISLYKHMCQAHRPCTIVLTDYDPGSLKLLEENCQLNRYHCDDQTSSSGTHISVTPLQWGQSVPEELHDCVDLVIGSDLLYCVDIVSPLFSTVNSMLRHRPPLQQLRPLPTCSQSLRSPHQR